MASVFFVPDLSLRCCFFSSLFEKLFFARVKEEFFPVSPISAQNGLDASCRSLEEGEVVLCYPLFKLLSPFLTGDVELSFFFFASEQFCKNPKEVLFLVDRR